MSPTDDDDDDNDDDDNDDDDNDDGNDDDEENDDDDEEENDDDNDDNDDNDDDDDSRNHRRRQKQVWFVKLVNDTIRRLFECQAQNIQNGQNWVEAQDCRVVGLTGLGFNRDWLVAGCLPLNAAG